MEIIIERNDKRVKIFDRWMQVKYELIRDDFELRLKKHR